jgi:5'-nucleotidase
VKSILLTNDDGIDAEGLNALMEGLRRVAHVTAIAPDQNRSAISHGLTIHRTRLKFEETGPDCLSLNGTPADCVIYALDNLFVAPIKPPDLVISGINHGTNVGDDVMYSGTVAAAREAARYGIPAIAVSQEYEHEEKIRFKEGIKFIVGMVETMLYNGIDGELLLNINIPVGKIKGTKITRLECTENMKHFNIRRIGQASSSPDTLNFQKNELITDRAAISNGYVSITPLQRDQTDYADARALMESAGQLFTRRG